MKPIDHIIIRYIVQEVDTSPKISVLNLKGLVLQCFNHKHERNAIKLKK